MPLLGKAEDNACKGVLALHSWREASQWTVGCQQSQAQRQLRQVAAHPMQHPMPAKGGLGPRATSIHPIRKLSQRELPSILQVSTTTNHAEASAESFNQTPTGRSCIGHRKWLCSERISQIQMFLTPRISTHLEGNEAAVPSNCCIGQGVSQSVVVLHLMLKPLQATTWDCGFWQPKTPSSAKEEPSTSPNRCRLRLEAIRHFIQALSSAPAPQQPWYNAAY